MKERPSMAYIKNIQKGRTVWSLTEWHRFTSRFTFVNHDVKKKACLADALN